MEQIDLILLKQAFALGMRVAEHKLRASGPFFSNEEIEKESEVVEAIISKLATLKPELAKCGG